MGAAEKKRVEKKKGGGGGIELSVLGRRMSGEIFTSRLAHYLI